MNRRHSLVRRVTSTAVSVAMLAAAVLACVPVTAVTAESHCAPAEMATHCQRTPVLDCCDSPSQNSPALPDGSPSARADETRSAAGLETASEPTCPLPASLEDRLAHAQPHGIRHVDLTTLNSVFLI